jgi:AAA+ ATPase superfamily predicted ATPase
VRPDIPDLPTLFSVLYRLAADERMLVVLDEFPYLLPSRVADRDDLLTAVQAVMEERDASKLKLVLCGSHIGQMGSLLSESSPLRGRLTPLRIDPLRLADAQAFVDAGTATERIERYAVAGGTTLYLDELGHGGTLRRRVCESVLDSRGPLFDDPREVLEQDLRQPGVYFSLLEELSAGERALADLAAALGTRTNELGPYLSMLREMQLVEQVAPVTSAPGGRDRRYRLGDGFLRFWFRFVFPFQEDLRTGLRPADHFDGEIAPALADHVAPVFESLCREWTRRTLGRRASRVGSWWGPALNALRRSRERFHEEIDIVGTSRSAVTLAGECKWTGEPMSAKVLSDLEIYKLPALRQAKAKIAARGPLILLFSKSGFDDRLVTAAAEREDLLLVDAEQVVTDLSA